MSPASSNVRVAVRLRPLNSRERLAGSDELVVCDPNSKQIIAGPEHCFTYDSVFGADSIQDDLFTELARPLLDSFITGFNCTILAYGQTGSGKTFTMGTGLDGNLDESTQGLVPRAVNYLMDNLQREYGALEDTGTGKNPATGAFFEIYTSFLEIYNEEIIDLLAPNENNGAQSDGNSKRKSSGFSIREDAKGEIYLTGIREEKILNCEEIFALLQKGSLSRTTKSTEMNMVSSRSHAIFTILLRQRREDGAKVLASKLHFVDLAGSERLKRTQARGDRVKESISINSGLLALGNVISALGDPNRRSTHIPYRNSKLTRMLQDSLGGNSQTLMIACASPSSDNFAESLNTLKYADRAKNIRNSVQINEEIGGSGAFEVSQLKKQVATLKQEILHLRTTRRSESNENSSTDGMNGKICASGSNGRNAIDQAELARLRVQNSELKRRVTQMSKEKATIEAERDAYKNAAGPNASKTPNIKIIAELKGRIAELESCNLFNKPSGNTNGILSNTNTNNFISSTANSNNNNSNNNNNIAAPQTPVWLRQANVLVNKARDEIRDNFQTIRKIEFDNFQPNSNVDSAMCIDDDEPMTPSKSKQSNHSLQNNSLSLSQQSLNNFNSQQHGVLQLTQSQFAAAVATRCENLMSRVRSDLSLKEDLIRQFEICQAEYSSMRRNYDEKMRLVQENLQQAQKERDLAIKKAMTTTLQPSVMPTVSISNRRYEEKIKALGKELNVALASATEAQKALQTRASGADASLKSLRTQMESMRTERSKLLAQLSEEKNRVKYDCFAHEQELTELRQREYRATESSRKLKKAYDFQKALLQKRIEQNHQARTKIRQLLFSLKKRSNGSVIEGFDDMGEDFMDENVAENENENENSDVSNSQNSAGASSESIVQPVEIKDQVEVVSDDEEILLQLNEQTKAVLNDEIVMMDIDSAPSTKFNDEYSSDHLVLNHFNQFMDEDLHAAPTGEVPRSALRHSPLISRRRDVFAKLNENKKNSPFQ